MKKILPKQDYVRVYPSASCPGKFYLEKLLPTLNLSHYTIKNAKQFVEQIPKKHVPAAYMMVSFDIKSLSTNVPLETTIDITLE